MSAKRKIELSPAVARPCDETVVLVKRIACSSCDVEILDMHDPAVAAKAKSYGIHTVPAVVIDDRLAGAAWARVPTRPV